MLLQFLITRSDVRMIYNWIKYPWSQVPLIYWYKCALHCGMNLWISNLGGKNQKIEFTQDWWYIPKCVDEHVYHPIYDIVSPTREVGGLRRVLNIAILLISSFTLYMKDKVLMFNFYYLMIYWINYRILRVILKKKVHMYFLNS